MWTNVDFIVGCQKSGVDLRSGKVLCLVKFGAHSYVLPRAYDAYFYSEINFDEVDIGVWKSSN